jgi:multidrug efflux pump
MGQISGAIIGVTVMLIASPCPWHFAGSVGNIYRQFSAVMVSLIAFSAFLALSLTPLSAPRCSNRLKLVTSMKEGLSAGLTEATRTIRVTSFVLIKRAGRYLIIYAIIAVVGLLTPGCLQRFAPGDQDNLVVNISCPGATQERTVSVVQQVKPSCSSLRLRSLWAFSASAFWTRAKRRFGFRDSGITRNEKVKVRAQPMLLGAHLVPSQSGWVFPLSPPPIRELGTNSGFNLRLQDRTGVGGNYQQRCNQLLGLASKARSRAGPP